jgi:hypothetical protein
MDTPKRVQSGSSLIEVLVALLLLSFCILGLARLMAGNLRAYTESVIQANLNHLANDAFGPIPQNFLAWTQVWATTLRHRGAINKMAVGQRLIPIAVHRPARTQSVPHLTFGNCALTHEPFCRKERLD